jgi:RNA polymerase sigma-70 factor (ECF subfamily)
MDKEDISSNLLEKIAQGCDASFRSLYNQYARRVYRYVVLKTKNVENAEEILQETFLAIWNTRKKLPGVRSANAWIMQIARNKLADSYRRERATEYSTNITEEKPTVPVEEVVDLKDAIAGLKSEERELLYLIFHLRMDYRDVADVMGVPVGTVKSRLFYIKKKLRGFLQG